MTGAPEHFAASGDADEERGQAWQAIIAETFPGMAVQPRSAATSGALYRWRLNGVSLMRVQAHAAHIRRRPTAPAGHLLLHIPNVGRCEAVQGRHRAVARAGDVLLCHSDTPYELETSGYHDCLIVQVPLSVLDVPGKGTGTGARTLAGPAVRLLHHWMLELWREGARMGAERAVLDEVIAGMVRMVLRSGAAARPVPARPGRAGLIDYVDRHYSDPELCTAKLAVVTGLSHRALQKAFADAGTTPTAYIRSRRLAQASVLLRASPGRSITEIAYAVGFNDAAFFSRHFHRAFHVAPGTWRRGTGGAGGAPPG